MSLSRRSVIFAAGGAGLALVGSLGAYRVTRRPTTALEPWRLAGPPPRDVRLDALRHAILAPNPHNRQPWLMRLEGEDGVIVSCDLDRRLPATDPFDRQITIGFGAFLDLARIAAAERGHRVETTPFPDGEPPADARLDGRPIARLRFVPDPALGRDPLFAAVALRRSTKEPYDMTRPVPATLLDRLAAQGSEGAAVAATADPARVADLRALILDAGTIEGTVPRTHQESVDLIRIGHAEIDAAPDGIDLDGPVIEGLALAGLVSRDQIADPGSSAYKSGMERQRSIYGSGLAHLWVATPGNTRRDQLAAGAAYLRANLAATGLGLAMHPASQALQEYPEMREPFDRVHRLLGVRAPERVQMLARVGYGPQVPPSPRWPLESRLVPA